MDEYCEENAKCYAEETLSANLSEQYQRVIPLLKEGVRILDVGSGSGLDVCYFPQQRYQVIELKSSRNLCLEIRKVFSGEVVCSDIQSYQPTQRFDGIWSCASLIHLSEEDLLCFFRKVDLYLNDNGVVYISGKTGIPTGKSADGCYFLEFTEQLVEKTLAVNAKLKMKELQYAEDVSGTKGFRWMNVIFKMMQRDDAQRY